MSPAAARFDTDVLIVGAGMAGLAAAEVLSQASVAHIVVEARGVIGGRIQTHYEAVGGQRLPIEIGAEFIHWEAESSRLWRSLIKTHSLTEEEIDSAGQTILAGRLLHDRRDRTPKSSGMMRELHDRVEEYLARGGRDMPVRLFVRRNPLKAVTTRAHHELLRAIIANEYGEGPDRLSLRALLEPESYSRKNYRVREGFQALVHGLGLGVADLRTNTPVRTIRWGEGRVAVETERGEILTARRAIVTIPVGMLHEGVPAFDPPLPDDKQNAIAGLSAGRVTKVVMQFRKRFWGTRMVFLRGGRQQLSWAPLALHDRDAPYLTALVGGKDADALAEIGGGEAARTVAREIMKAYEVKNPRDLFVNGRIAAWHREPYIRTGYSSLRVGAPKNVREMLGVPVADQLWFAGEAASSAHPATVTGAMETGRLAAEHIIERFRSQP